MKTLYVDNYKGFSNTFIPFEDVSFLVGNNSTGKTSILNLITLMGNPSFWMNPDFNTENIELGSFEEIVSKQAINRSYFSIGAEFEREKEKDYFLIRFIEKKGIPSIDNYQIAHRGKTVYIIIDGNRVDYHIYHSGDVDFHTWVDMETDNLLLEKHLFEFPAKQIPPIGVLLNLIQSKEAVNDNQDQVQTILLDTLQDNLKVFAPIRAKAQRNYNSYKQNFNVEGEHIPAKLKEIFSSRNLKNYKNIKNKIIAFGVDSGLFDNINIEEYAELASAPFAINICYDDMPLNIANVGYGVSQIIPIIVEMASKRDTWFSIQQPEVHLHPRAQASFGEFVFQSFMDNNNKFIIETHSDYTINRFRYCLSLLSGKKKKKPKAQILFFERTREGNKVSTISFNNKGDFDVEIPENYSKFFIDEELKLLGL